MSKIPFDIIFGVFFRLPPKSLVRFKCLSKPCCSMIDDPDFIRIHLDHSIKTKSNLNLILRWWDLYTVDFDSLDVAVPIDLPFGIASGIQAFGSCNGLIGLRNSEECVALFNPSTRKLKKFHIAPIEFHPGSGNFGYVFYGFGQDLVSKDLI